MGARSSPQTETGIARLHERVADLERRQQALEDEREIRALLADYGARADRGDHDGFVELFTADGVMRLLGGAPGVERDDELRWAGAEELRRFIDDPSMHMRIEGRCMHVSGLGLRVSVDGDEAVADSCSIVIVAEAGGLRLYGGGFERWSLRRSGGSWRIAERMRTGIGSGAPPAAVD